MGQAEGEKHHRIHACTGKAMKCDAYEQEGCAGCAQEECCDIEGDCEGYNRGGNDNEIETKVIVVTEPLECPPQNNVDVDINISELNEGETGVDVDVTFDKANGTSVDDGNEDGSGENDEGNEEGSDEIEDGSGENDNDSNAGNDDGSGETQDDSGDNDVDVDVDNEEGSSNGTNTHSNDSDNSTAVNNDIEDGSGDATD